MDRRRLLAVVGASTSLAGCISPRFSSSNSETGWATGTPSQLPVQTDSDRYQFICSTGARLSFAYDIEYSERSGFSIEAASDSLSMGDVFAVRLTNESGEERTISTRGAYDIQQKSEGGWRSVYRYEPSLVLERIGRVIGPGEDMTWNLGMTKIGITHYLNKESELLACCSPLEQGKYRFVYWGIPDGKEDGSGANSGIAVRFQLTDEG